VAFWEVIPCSWWMATTVLEEVYGPHLHVWKISEAGKKRKIQERNGWTDKNQWPDPVFPFPECFLTWRWMQEASPECWLTSTMLHGPIFQKTPNTGAFFKMISVPECMYNVRRRILLRDYTQ
jgi:hypothetical protein